MTEHTELSWWDRHWLKVCLALLFLWTTFGFVRIQEEGHTREEQFCGLTLGAHHDKVKRLNQTKIFLESEYGEKETSLNLYIKKVSLPQTVIEVKKEEGRLPTVCLKYEPDKATNKKEGAKDATSKGTD